MIIHFRQIFNENTLRIDPFHFFLQFSATNLTNFFLFPHFTFFLELKSLENFLPKHESASLLFTSPSFTFISTKDFCQERICSYFFPISLLPLAISSLIFFVYVSLHKYMNHEIWIEKNYVENFRVIF